MALFDTPSPHTLHALLRVGFSARLRSELADIFLSHTSEGQISRTDDRTSATVFTFLTADKTVPTPPADPTFLVALIASSPPSSDAHFLTFAPDPCLTTKPSLLRLTLSQPHSRSPSRTLFSLCAPTPPPTPHLTLRDVPRGGSAVTTLAPTKHALFHLEILPATIGTASLPPPPTSPDAHILPSQALVHALLQLGVRVRLRTTHNRTLCAPGKAARPVVQGSPMPSHSTSDTDLLLTAAMLSGTLQDAASRAYALCDVLDNKQQLRLVATAPPTLSPGSTVVVRAGESSWGELSLASKGADEKLVWLMAAPRGALEMRSHRRAWETLSLQFVAQTLPPALAALPDPALWTAADEATRAVVRRVVAARVAGASAEKKKGGKSTNGFNHAAALAALGDEEKVPEKPKKTQNNSGKKGKGKTGGAQTVRSVAPASAGTLPRSKANKKAAKNARQKRRAEKRAASNGSGAAVSAAVGAAAKSSGRAGSSGTEDESAITKEGGKADNTSGTASQSERAPSASGPPCDACGLPMSGAYTTAMGKKMHASCFCCGRCRRPMGGGPGRFREKGGVPYCENCYAMHIAQRCARCTQPILETVITAMERTWHKNCLTCTICQLPLTETFWLYADRPREPRCSRCMTGEEHVQRRQSRPGSRLGGRSAQTGMIKW